MTVAEAQQIGRGYGLNVTRLEALRAGSVNSNFRLETSSGARYFMRVYEEQDFAGARAEVAMIRQLAELGVPTPAPLERLDGDTPAAHAGKPVAIYPWIDGDILCSRQVTPAVAQALGRALARVHACTERLSRVPRGRFGLDGLQARLDGIERQSAAYGDDTRFIRQKLAQYGAGPRDRLPRGLIHGDLFRDNVLWQDGELAALIDFESASEGIFAYDVMVCVHAWCYRDAFDAELVRALIDGYCSVRPLEAVEWAQLRSEGALAALRFATTRISDFELRTPPGEAPARDYRRFLQRLAALEAGVLDPIIKRGST
jgi:homoserine kinase type II